MAQAQNVTCRWGKLWERFEAPVRGGICKLRTCKLLILYTTCNVYFHILIY